MGHFAKYAEQRVADSDSENLLIQLAMETSARTGKPIDQRAIDNVAQEIKQDIDTQEARRVYDAPSKGVLWGWEVTAYVWTKAIATGTFLMMAVWIWLNGGINAASEMNGLLTSLVFMGITGALLVKDLDRPDRFLYVLLRPQWKSWLVRGAYIIMGFGGLITIKLFDSYFGWGFSWLMIPGAILAILGRLTFPVSESWSLHLPPIGKSWTPDHQDRRIQWLQQGRQLRRPVHTHRQDDGHSNYTLLPYEYQDQYKGHHRDKPAYRIYTQCNGHYQNPRFHLRGCKEQW